MDGYERSSCSKWEGKTLFNLYSALSVEDAAGDGQMQVTA